MYVRRRALLIGETDYESGNTLNGCVNDINALGGTLDGLRYRFRTTKLSNTTKAQVLNAIASTFADTTDDDVSLFFYSGHGLNYIGSNESTYQKYEGALCMVNGEYITFSDLADAFANVKGKVIFIFSSCHSGASISKSTEDELDAFNASAIAAFSALDEQSTAGTRMGELRQSRFYVITAASYAESGWEGRFDGSGYIQGALAAAVVKGIGGKYPSGSYTGSMPADSNKNSQVTLKEIYTYAYNLSYKWTNVSGTNYTPQHVQYYGTDTAVLFRR